jgi:ribosomal protein S18 acetylase RimI-like enzyme
MALLTVGEVDRNAHPVIMLEALRLMDAEVWGWQASPELAHADMKRVVAASTEDSQVVAAGSIMLLDHPFHGYISELATHPHHRHQGLGSRVLKHLEQIANEAGALEVAVTLPRELGSEGFFIYNGYRTAEGLDSEHDLIKELGWQP